MGWRLNPKQTWIKWLFSIDLCFFTSPIPPCHKVSTVLSSQPVRRGQYKFVPLDEGAYPILIGNVTWRRQEKVAIITSTSTYYNNKDSILLCGSSAPSVLIYGSIAQNRVFDKDSILSRTIKFLTKTTKLHKTFREVNKEHWQFTCMCWVVHTVLP